jgi:hypothetical protein
MGENVAYVWRRGVYRVLLGKPEVKGPLGRPSVDGMVLLKWIFKNLDD